MARKPILSIDFDGTLHPYTEGWQGANTVADEPPIAGSIEFLREAVEHFTVAIFSSRSAQEGGLEAMQAWLQRFMLGDDRRVFDQLQWPRTKPAAKISIDDRAWPFAGAWPTIDQLRDFRTWQGK
jgi:hypothetical protein